MTRLLVATSNSGKLAEIRGLLRHLSVEISTLRDLRQGPEPEETGTTFPENARLKALYYDAVAETSPRPAPSPHRYTVAEDSGLVIDALDGEPGVRSARFLQPDATYPERFSEIYRRLNEARPRAWDARFVCALAVVRAGTVVYETSGTIEGRIAAAPSGTGGFGYDPIFYVPLSGRTLAEINESTKARISHRGEALRRLADWLEPQLEPNPVGSP
jgi:XTP/dITP diphosphohydrolase